MILMLAALLLPLAIVAQSHPAFAFAMLTWVLTAFVAQWVLTGFIFALVLIFHGIVRRHGAKP